MHEQAPLRQAIQVDNNIQIVKAVSNTSNYQKWQQSLTIIMLYSSHQLCGVANYWLPENILRRWSRGSVCAPQFSVKRQ